MRPLLLLVVAVSVGVARAALNGCWERPGCEKHSSESRMMDCVQLCGLDPHEMTTILNSVHLQPPPSSLFVSPSPFSSHTKHYSIEHFRWGKPLGRKRHPGTPPDPTSSGGDPAELFPRELKKSAPEDEEQGPQEEDEHREEKDIPYEMKHFRWSGPAAGKRYGGFMKSWEEHSKRPLLTLFRNVINKVGEKNKRAN